jgi:hypothetical protein
MPAGAKVHGTAATADAEGLRRFVEEEVLPWFESRNKELATRPLIREQAFGEALDPDKLERLGRYEVHLDRKLERVLAMLLRFKDLRRPVDPEGLNLQRLETFINVDLPWNPARLEQRKGRIDRIGQLASSIDILNLRYRGSVEDEVHHVLSSRLRRIGEIFGTIPDTLEDVWVATAMGEIEEARRRIDEVPSRHPFDIRYAQDLPERAWERCAQVLDRYDAQRLLRKAWS